MATFSSRGPASPFTSACPESKRIRSGKVRTMRVARLSTVTSRPTAASSSFSRPSSACGARSAGAAGTASVTFCFWRLSPKSSTKQTISSMKTSVRVRSQISLPASAGGVFFRKRSDPAAFFSGTRSGISSPAVRLRAASGIGLTWPAQGSAPAPGRPAWSPAGGRPASPRASRACSGSPAGAPGRRGRGSPPGRCPSAAR